MKPNLRFKVLSGILLASLIFSGIVALALPPILRQMSYQDLEGVLTARSGLIRRLFELQFRHSPSPNDLLRVTREVGASTRTRVTLVGPGGEVWADSGSVSERLKAPPVRSDVSRAFTVTGTGDRTFLTRTSDRMTVTTPVLSGGKAVAVVQVSVPLETVEERVRAMLMLALKSILLLAFCMMALIYVFLKSTTQPLRLMSRNARRIAEGEPYQRVRVRYRDEVGELAQAFNQMSRVLDTRMGQLREAETTMRTAFAHMADGVVVLDSAGRVLLFNAVAEETFGRSAAKAQGRTLLDIALHPDLDTLVSDALRAGEQGSKEIQLWRPTLRILRAYVTPVPSEEGSLIGAVLVFQDLTEIRRLENIRRDFVTNASHELKTPLATINVMVDTLKGGMAHDPETARRFLGTIGTEVQRLGALVDDLLDLSRLETGNIAVECEVIALEPVLKSLGETYRPAAEQRHQTLAVRSTCETLVWADPHAVIRIASNLIENALKYTPEGGRIEVSCGREGREAFLRVADNGIGISEAEQGRIFERFYRVDKARSRATGGTGLGLSIVKHLVEAHGGRIEVESTLGRGSVFTVWLPAITEEDWRDDDLSPEPVESTFL